MKRKCPKCKNDDMRVWALVASDGMFLQCKSCNWKSKDLPWTKCAKAEWDKLNTRKEEEYV